MAIHFTVGFEESFFRLDGVSALHIRCTSAEAATASNLYAFDVTLRSTSGKYSQSWTNVLMTEGSAAVSIPFSVPLAWADDFVQNLGDAAYADACGQFEAVMTAHYTMYAGTAKITADYTGYAARISGSVPQALLPAAGTLTAAEENSLVPAGWGVYVQGISRVRVTAAGASAPAGATIVAYAFGGAAQQNENSALIALPAAGSVSVPVCVTDSCGRTAAQDLLLTVESYSPPVLTGIRSQRCTADGTADENGTCFCARFTRAGSTLGGENPLTVTCAWKKVTQEEYGEAVTLAQDTAVLDAALEAGASYTVRYTVRDAFHSAEYEDYVSSTVYLLHFLKGGTGIAVGKAAEAENCFDVGLAAQFRRDVDVGGTLRLGGEDVGAALRGVGNVTQTAVILSAAAMPSASENMVMRCGRLVLVRLHGTLQNDQNSSLPPYEGETYRVGALPTGYFGEACPPLAFACQNGFPCRASADAQGNLYVTPAADGRTDTELYAVGLV